MRLELDRLGQIKSYIHAGQGAILFLASVLTIAIFTRDGSSDGRVGWYFGLCWLTIPILIYLVMVPAWSRAQRFANVYAFATLDAASVVMWLSAWASVASYVNSGKGQGTNSKATGCDNFKFGSAGRCKLSEAIIVLGVFIMLAFIATAYISLGAVMHFKRTGTVPESMATTHDFSAQTQDAFSSNMQTEEVEEDRERDPRQGGYTFHKQSLDEEYALVHQHDHEDLDQVHPTQPRGPLEQNGLGIHDYDTSYGGASGRHQQSASPPVFERAYGDHSGYGR